MGRRVLTSEGQECGMEGGKARGGKKAGIGCMKGAENETIKNNRQRLGGWHPVWRTLQRRVE
jgi:hypothetical protein